MSKYCNYIAYGETGEPEKSAEKWVEYIFSSDLMIFQSEVREHRRRPKN